MATTNAPPLERQFHCRVVNERGGIRDPMDRPPSPHGALRVDGCIVSQHVQHYNMIVLMGPLGGLITSPWGWGMGWSWGMPTMGVGWPTMARCPWGVGIPPSMPMGRMVGDLNARHWCIMPRAYTSMPIAYTHAPTITQCSMSMSHTIILSHAPSHNHSGPFHSRNKAPGEQIEMEEKGRKAQSQIAPTPNLS